MTFVYNTCKTIIDSNVSYVMYCEYFIYRSIPVAVSIRKFSVSMAIVQNGKGIEY